MTKAEYILKKEQEWLEEDENICSEMRKRIGNGEKVGYPDGYYLERLGFIYSEQERLQLFADEYEKENLNMRIDIPKGHGRYWFDKDVDENGNITVIRFIIAKSDVYAIPGTEVSGYEENLEDICSLEIGSTETALQAVKKFIELAAWMKENHYAEQERTGAGDDLAQK